MKGKSFLSKNTVRLFLNKKGMRVSSEFLPALEEKIQKLLEIAVERAGKNGRSTVMPQDL